MKKKYIALIMIVMAACFGTLALPSPAAKPAADTTVSVAYLQQIEQQNQRMLKELEMLDLEQRLTERIDKKTDRNLTLCIGLFGALITFLSIFVPMTINKNQEKRLNEQAERLECIKKEQDEMAQKLEKTANITQDATRKSEQAVADITSLKTTIQEYSEQAKDSVQKAQKSANEAKALTYFAEALKVEDLDRQIELYTWAIEKNPNYFEAYNNRGVVYGNRGEYDKAIEDYTEAIKIAPDYAYAYNNRGIAYRKKGELDNAIKDFDKAIEINPNDAEAYYNRGYAYDDMGELDKAIKDYDKAIEINPNFAEAYCNRGYAYDDMGELDKAIKDYDKAIKINPDYVEAYNNRGSAYLDMGEHDKAIEDYTKAIEINPEYAKAYINRANAYNHISDYDKAIKDCTKAIGINPNLAEAYNNRGEANKGLAEKMEAKGKTAEALELYKAAVKDFEHFLKLWTEDDENKEDAIRLKQECEEAIERLGGGKK